MRIRAGWPGIVVLLAAAGAARGEPQPCIQCRDATCPKMNWLPKCPEKASPPAAPATKITAPAKAPAPEKTAKPKTPKVSKTKRDEGKSPQIATPAVTPLPSEMVRVPAGCFYMGSDEGDKDADSDEKPAHEVCLGTFDIDKYEVTNEAYQRCVNAKAGCTDVRKTQRDLAGGPYNGAKQPVVSVTWYDAVSYCMFAGKKLPTEAEWEYAALGPDRRRYPWGNTIACGVANYDGGFLAFDGGCDGKSLSRPADIGSYPRDVSPFGAYDMGANVQEWVRDTYDENFYKRSSKGNPYNKGILDDEKSVRGGAWLSLASDVRSAHRRGGVPSYGVAPLGFRCSRVVR